MEVEQIQPARGPLDVEVRIPGSKSLTNRAMILAALADGRSRLTGALFSDDTERMISCLDVLDVPVVVDRDVCSITVDGCCGHLPATEGELFCGNSGTTIRFCAAICALGYGPYVLDGIERMRERPIGALVDGLRDLGIRVGYEGAEGYPPIGIRGGGLRGGRVVFNSPSSSQFVSAVLMVAPHAGGDVFVEVRGQIVSAPYLSMTTRLMEVFGVSVVEQCEEGVAKFIIPAPQRYTACGYAIEPDASNASYFLAAPAVAGGRVTVLGLGTNSIQGDVGFVGVLEQMGCRVERGEDSLTVWGPSVGERLRGVDVDLNRMPDTAQTLAVAALFADGPTTIRNVANMRIKETDRLSALAAELVKLGARVDERRDGLTIHPPEKVNPAQIATYDDHRMAMSFSLAGLGAEGVEIMDPRCVEKTFPSFFEHFGVLCR